MSRLKQQHHDCSHMDKPQVVAARLLVPRRYSTVLLDPVDKSLRQIAFLVSMLVVLSFDNPVLLWRDHRLRPGRLDRCYEIVPVISLIRDHRLDFMILDQGKTLVDVGLLSPGQDQLDRVSQAVDGDVKLGPEPAPRASQRLVGTPFFAAPAAC